jgi:hypothetical protein
MNYRKLLTTISLLAVLATLILVTSVTAYYPSNSHSDISIHSSSDSYFGYKTTDFQASSNKVYLGYGQPVKDTTVTIRTTSTPSYTYAPTYLNTNYNTYSYQPTYKKYYTYTYPRYYTFPTKTYDYSYWRYAPTYSFHDYVKSVYNSNYYYYQPRYSSCCSSGYYNWRW